MPSPFEYETLIGPDLSSDHPVADVMGPATNDLSRCALSARSPIPLQKHSTRARPVRFPAILLSHLGTMTVLLAIAASSAGQEAAAPACTDCHDRSTSKLEDGTLAELLADSVHKSLSCTNCHEAISMEELAPESPQPHGEAVSPVDCGECHDEEAEAYEKHGRFDVGSSPDIPACWDCHSAHDVLPSSDRRSSVHRHNIPKTCMTCHGDVNLIKDHELLRNEPIKLYMGSVHAKASEGGLYLAATCSDCHSSGTADGKPTAHRILSSADPESTINHFNIPDTCGKCHRGTTVDYWEGIHGQLAKRGKVDAPVCTHCHGEHGILSTADLRSPVSAARLAEATCSPCHESAVLNERYGIPAGRLKSYVDSYHGLKRKAGNVHVANCASCHGSHRILPHTDPRSSIYPDNLQGTCGECHPGISAVLAQSPIHETATGIKTGWPRFFTVFYMWIIGITIGLMLLHNIGHWFRHARLRAAGQYVIRLTAGEAGQHWVLMISFTVLVFSGFSLRFSEAWWAELLFGWGGGQGFVIRGLVHRVAAVMFMVWAVWHAIYLCTRRGRQWARDMIGSRQDLRDIKHNALFFLSLRDSEARFGRFSYMEKCEYWAMIWGAVIMTATGLLLWFDNYFVEAWHLPKGVLDVALVIHYYEAWLAALAILVWHIYGTVFSPTVFPMNPAWWAGRMPKEMYDHEHPEGPKLKSRVRTIDPEAEEEPDKSAKRP